MILIEIVIVSQFPTIFLPDDQTF
jgi:hypothetical protein